MILFAIFPDVGSLGVFIKIAAVAFLIKFLLPRNKPNDTIHRGPPMEDDY